MKGGNMQVAVDSKEAPGSGVGASREDIICKCRQALDQEGQKVRNLLDFAQKMIEFGDGGDKAAFCASRDFFLHRLSIIGEALERIENGAFGVCVDCGGPISERRLSVLLLETRCIACQSKNGRR